MKSIEDKIPQTGRIGRFVKILEKEVSKDSMIRILQDSEKYKKYSPSKKAEWWKNTINQMENEIGKEKTKEILFICGSKCCGQGHRNKVRKKFEDSKTIEEFLDKISLIYSSSCGTKRSSSTYGIRPEVHGTWSGSPMKWRTLPGRCSRKWRILGEWKKP